jgi:hypothetical protein
MKTASALEAVKLRKRHKDAEKRISRAYHETCAGIQIDMMDIPRIFKLGRQYIAEGIDDAGLRERLRNFVETIRVDRGKRESAAG